MKIKLENLSSQIQELGQSGVYKIINEINEKWYVGSTKMPFFKRFYRHRNLLRKNNHPNPHLQNSYNKHGENNFSFSVVIVLSHSDSLKKEQEILDLNKDNKLCYNICSNAVAPMTGRKHSKESLLKMSIASKKRSKEIGECTRRHRLGTKHPAKTIKKMKVSAKQRDDSKRVDVLKSDEYRHKMSKIMSGKKWTPERREHALKVMQSEEYRINMSIATKGIPKSEEWKSKASKAKLGKQIVLTKDGVSEILISMRNFCAKYRLDRHKVSDLIQSKIQEYKGWSLSDF